MTATVSRPAPIWQIALWSALALVVVPLFGPRFVQMLKPPPGYFMDFSQEWLSARNYWTGSPVYSPQLEALKLHTGQAPDNPDEMLPWNAHPPASILVALPFGQITDYPTAHLAWNLVSFSLFVLSVALVIQQLDVDFRMWSLVPAAVITLASHPVLFNLIQGQINFLVLALITLAWVADRNDRQTLAGLALGTAVGIKLFPGLLFVYLLFARRWRALVVGVLVCGLVNAVAATLFGTAAFETYVREVVPSVLGYQSSWRNVSLTGVWTRAYNPSERERVIALAESPGLARGLTLASQVLVAGGVAWAAFVARTVAGRDRAFAAGVLGMVLASPVAWTQYFVLLVLPLGLLWMRLSSVWSRSVFWLLFIVLVVPENFFALLVLGREQVQLMGNNQHAPLKPAVNFSALSVFTYALVLLFMMVLVVVRGESDPPPEPPRPDLEADVPVDEQRVDRRLFGHIGDD